MYTLYVFGFAIGLILPVQAAINHLLKASLAGSTVLAAGVSFAVGMLTLLGVAAATQQPWSTLASISRVPLWQLSGGLMGALFVFGTTFLSPRIGAASLIALLVAGQVCTSLLLDHTGSLGLPVRLLSWPKALGALCMIVGVLLVNFGERWFALAR